MPLPQITWDDVQQLPDDGNRYEAIAGELYVTPAPSVRHQTVSKRLQVDLMRILEDPGYGQVWDAPLGVRFPVTGEGVQPDLLSSRPSVAASSRPTSSRERRIWWWRSSLPPQSSGIGN
jgi:Uma2 family endonuclease